MEKILDIENDGLNLAMDDEYLYIRCKKTMYKYKLSNMSLVCDNKIFTKDGKARTFSINSKYLCLLDFCDLYILDINNLHIVKLMHLGIDLSSNLVAVRQDEEKAYISMRHGKMIIVNLATFDVHTASFGDTSSWEHSVYQDRLYIGTIDGKLVEMSTSDYSVIKTAELGKKNIYSSIREGNIIYTVSQDMSIKAIDSDTFNIMHVTRNAVKGMIKIIGIFKDCVVVADNRISLWNKDTLELKERIFLPTGQFNKGVVLHKNILIGSDYHSIYKIEL